MIWDCSRNAFGIPPPSLPQGEDICCASGTSSSCANGRGGGIRTRDLMHPMHAPWAIWATPRKGPQSIQSIFECGINGKITTPILCQLSVDFYIFYIFDL